MKLIVGLGNPDKKYENNRHNIGFAVVDLFASENSIDFSEKFNGLYKTVNHNGEKFVLAKPLTYMNNSGDFVKKISDFYNIQSKDILVIVDDKDMEIGKIRIRTSGSSGGQNGIKSIVNQLKTDEFNRLKIGVGSPMPGQDTANYVLSDFNKEQKEIIKQKQNTFIEICNDFISMEIKELMNK